MTSPSTEEAIPREGEILELLACPLCRTRLSPVATTACCPSCGREYRQRGTAWDLTPPGAVLAGLESKLAPRRGWQQRLRPPSPSLNVNRQRLQRLVTDTSASGPVLDLGSGGRRLGERVINLDLDLLTDVDVIGSADTLPFLEAASTWWCVRPCWNTCVTLVPWSRKSGGFEARGLCVR